MSGALRRVSVLVVSPAACAVSCRRCAQVSTGEIFGKVDRRHRRGAAGRHGHAERSVAHPAASRGDHRNAARTVSRAFRSAPTR